jgi:hypothetical protein
MNFISDFEPIAVRRLKAGDEEVVVTIGRPSCSMEDDFSCPYRIVFLGRVKEGYVYGVDAVQALQLVMSRIGVELMHLKVPSGAPLVWLDDGIGFPCPE